MLELMSSWGKTPVMAKDTPGFIVNKVARPFYSEAIKLYEEGVASVAEIDAAVKEHWL
jgi:3-hydroxybutyryl-CoA dehydrogenase